MLKMDRSSIVTLPAEVLRRRAHRVRVVDDNVQKLAQNMQAAALDWEDHRKNEVAAALAAPQVGVAERVIIVRSNFSNSKDRSFQVLLNPEVTKTEGKPVADSEGCLSVADVYGMVPRYPKVKVKATNLDGELVRITAEGFLARVLQHEIDHLHGKLFIDRIPKGPFYLIKPSGKLEELSKEDYGKYQLAA